MPFSSSRKWSAASFGGDGSWVLGGPEILVEHATSRECEALVARQAGAGRRVLLLARSPAGLWGETLPAGLEPAALVVLEDPIRPQVAATIAYFQAQGVALKVLSGDDPRTAGAIAGKLDLLGSTAPVDARRLPEARDELADAVEAGTVFGRVSPHQKLAMVTALQSRGHVVAMVGDGVNDVLALKQADIGVAFASGSGVSRAVAQVLLVDNSFWVLTVVARPLTAPRRWLLATMACSFACVFTVAPIRHFFGLVPTPLFGWATAAAAAVVAVAAVELGWHQATGRHMPARARIWLGMDEKVERRS